MLVNFNLYCTETLKDQAIRSGFLTEKAKSYTPILFTRKTIVREYKIISLQIEMILSLLPNLA